MKIIKWKTYLFILFFLRESTCPISCFLFFLPSFLFNICEGSLHLLGGWRKKWVLLSAVPSKWLKKLAFYSRKYIGGKKQWKAGLQVWFRYFITSINPIYIRPYRPNWINRVGYVDTCSDYSNSQMRCSLEGLSD